jgi:hypothetical protein
LPELLNKKLQKSSKLPVSGMFGDGTLALGLASVAQLLANRSLEETLAAFTAHSSIMPAWNITHIP